MRLLRGRPGPKDSGYGENSRTVSNAASHGGERFFCLPIRLLIIAEEEIVQALLHQAFGSSPQFKVVAITPEAIEAVQLARMHDVDVVLLNLMMPHMSGLAALELLRSELPCTKIISFSASESKEAVAVGASAVLDKVQRPLSELPQALSDLLQVSALERT